MKKSILFFSLLLIIFFGCNEDDPFIPPASNTAPFVGSFAFNGTHDYLAEVPIFDSTSTYPDYPVGFEFAIQHEFFSDSLNIELITNDSLQIILRNRIAKGTVINDTFFFNYNQSAYTNVDEIYGTVAKSNDSLFLFYRWKNGTNWDEQFPFYGDVNAKANQ